MRFTTPVWRSTNSATVHRLSRMPKRRLRFTSRLSRRMTKGRARYLPGGVERCSRVGGDDGGRRGAVGRGWGKMGWRGAWVVEKDTAFQAASEKLLLRTRRQYYSERQIENFHGQAL